MNDAKDALDSVIKKSRIHLYKPIQIAEILYHDRLKLEQFSLDDVSTYRVNSRKWRDAITQRLVGNISTSTSRFQDDLFNEHAIPPAKLAILGAINRDNNGIVENYIYHRFKERQEDVISAYQLIFDSDVTTFSLETLLNSFETKAGLK